MASPSEKLRLRFLEEYNRLNDQQRIAVDTIEGPVMVIAGPGTGKTQILASRIGKILLDTDAQPDNILCLTYTDSGVIAMRKRLLQFIGPDAYKVNIHTFHAFCNEVIQENLSAFEKTALDPISELESVELYKKLIDGFPANHPLKRYRGDVYYEINNLQNLFSSMKKEGWTPAFIEDKIDAYLTDIPTRDEFIYKRKYKQFNAGDLKVEKIQEEKDKMEKLRAAVKEFSRFQKMMTDRKRYDFDDMINWVIRAFEENKNLLSRYQEQYQYILVDEFQDTSGTQNKIVELLIQYWDLPNIFVVGDDDQSIYRFQGANIENMLQFANSYSENLKTIVLDKNYRSTQPILDLSHGLISRNEERLVSQLPNLTKDLIAENIKIKHLKHAPHIREYETLRAEMIDITQQVQELVKGGTAPGRISVIYRENRYGEELTAYFRLMNIPVYSKRNLNLFDLPLAQKVILLLRYLDAEMDTSFSGDEMLFELLHADWFEIAPIEIAKLSMERAEKRMPLRKLLVEKIGAPPKDLFSAALPENLQRAGKLMEELLSAVPNLTLQQLVEKIIRETGLLGNIMRAPDKNWQMQVLTSLFDFIKEETSRNPTMDLARLVRLLDLMEDEEVRLPLVQVSGSDKGVNLLTAHGAKGLEFEHVFVAGCNANFWEKKKNNRKGYRLPDTIFDAGATKDETEEQRRLFYVALTRAEQHLYISYSLFKHDGKGLEPSVFIEELKEQSGIPVEKIFISPEVLTQYANLRFGSPESPEIDKMEDDYVSMVLDKFVLNVTALNTYLKCPLEFYFRTLVRIPSPKNETLEFGSAAHYALEKLFKRMQEDPKEAFPTTEIFIDDFEWYMHRHRESFTREEFDRRMEYGREVLSNYYTARVPQFHKIVAIERNIRNVVVDNVPLKGKLDKLEFDGNAVNVVDYKTGNPDNARKKMKNPEKDPPNGGDYWRQAVFYKLLVDQYELKKWKAVSTEFDFIEPDDKKKIKTEKLIITEEDIAALREQIVTVWAKIQNREFYIGCGKEDCHWCNFVKTNKLAIAMHQIESSEETD